MLIGYDAAINGNLEVGKDVTILGRLNVKNFTNQNIINTTTNNYQLIVSEDLSLNGRMYVKGNVMIGSGNEPSYLLDVSSVSSQPFRVGVGATNALVVNSSGFVGIGTTNPVCPLTIVGGTQNNVGTSAVTTPMATAAALMTETKTALGSAAGNLQPLLYLKSNTGGGNHNLFSIYNYRKSDGSDWTTSSLRMQHTVDATNQAYLEFNPHGNLGGMGLYTFGSSAASGSSNLYTSTKGITIKENGNVGIGTTNPAVALDVVGNVRCTAGIDLNYSALPTYASNQIGYTGEFTTATPSNPTKAISASHNVYAFKNTLYFPVGVYLFFATTYNYDASIYVKARIFLTTSNWGTSTNINDVISTTSPISAINGTLMASTISNPNNFNFTDLIKVTTASSYYLGFNIEPYGLSTGATTTVNVGGFKCSFVRIA